MIYLLTLEAFGRVMTTRHSERITRRVNTYGVSLDKWWSNREWTKLFGQDVEWEGCHLICAIHCPPVNTTNELW